jgi:flagellar motor switch protein FliN/FliY
MNDVLQQAGDTAIERDAGSATDELTGLVADALSGALGEPLDHGPAEDQGGLPDLLPTGETRAVAATSNGETTHLIVVLAAHVADRLGPATTDWLHLLDAPFTEWASRSRVAVEGSLAVDGEAALSELLPRRRGLVLSAAGLFLGDAHVGSVATIRRSVPDGPGAPAAPREASAPDLAAPHVVMPGTGAHDVAAPDLAAPGPAAAAAPTGAVPGSPMPAAGRRGDPIQFLADVEMNVTAELGRCRMAVADLLSLSPGSVIELDRPAGGPIDLLVNGTLIARGEVVVIDEEFGVRITEIVGTED